MIEYAPRIPGPSRDSPEQVAITTVNRGAINSLESRCESPGRIRGELQGGSSCAREIPIIRFVSSFPRDEMRGTRDYSRYDCRRDRANAKFMHLRRINVIYFYEKVESNERLTVYAKYAYNLFIYLFIWWLYIEFWGLIQCIHLHLL